MFKSPNLSLAKLQDTTAWVGGGRRLCFLFPDSGKASCTSDGVSQVLEPGDVLVLSNGVGGAIRPLTGTEFSATYFLAFFESLASLFLVGEIVALENLIASLSQPRRFPSQSELAGECRPLLRSTPPKGLEQRGHLLGIAARIISKELRNGQSPAASSTACELTDLVSRMSLDDIQGLSVEELAVKMGYTPRHLQRLFRKSFGTSAARLKSEARILQSLRLLKDPRMKIIDVALACGFSHFGLFSQTFRHRFGVSAKEWRKQNHLPPDFCSQVNKQCGMYARGMCLWNTVAHPKSSGNGHGGNGHGSNGGHQAPRRPLQATA